MSAHVLHQDEPVSAHFEEKHFIVTDWCCQALCCLTCPIHWLPLCPGILGTKELVLEPEEAVLSYTCCGACNGMTRRPYGELGSVDEYKCCCFVGLSSSLTKDVPMCVGSGCNGLLVSEIVHELKARMKARGDTGQIQRAEALQRKLRVLQDELHYTQQCVELLLQDRNIALPPRTHTMEE